ncbi:leucine-rich repeat domain-containing protein [Wolbachia endosymbiont (group A) of Andrena dorsata]|uniref:leucine-rich repeat domain-containing protein n=1 Tax=Wolbachia endosymbiont (group A) of Andrena dorsata TaxID=2953975 RepID=UPI00222FDE02|nr:leucine-rich repeat domain-containing protein [Wolbachia endosymbiont (group A) of Andrena dorsata]
MSFDRYVKDDSLIIKDATAVDIGRLLSFLQSNTHIIRLSLKNCNVGSEVVEELTEPTTLNLLCNKIGDGVTRGLAKLELYTPSSLMSGYVDNRYTVSTKAVKKLAQLKNLTSLDLSSNKIDYEGVKELAQLKNLTSLNLSGNRIDDKGVKELTKLANLTSLSLVDCGIGYKDIGELAQLKNLTSLNLSSDKVSDKGVKELAKLANLTSLSLISCLISVRGVKELAKFTNLTSLNLSGNRIDDKGLKALTKSSCLKNLKKLRLGEIEIGIEGIESLAEIKNSGVKLIHSLKEISHRIFCDFLLKPRPHNQVTYKKGVKKMIFNVAQHDNSGKIVKHILTQPNKYHFLINSQDEQGHTLSHFYTHSPEMQEFLFKHGLIPEKEPELERDAELQGILRNRQSVHARAANKETCFFTAKLVKSINANENELKQAATSYMENVPKLLKQYQNDQMKVKLLGLTKDGKRLVMEQVLRKNAAVPDDKEFIEITFKKVEEVLKQKYLSKDQEGEYIEEMSRGKLQYDYTRDNAKVTIPESIGYIKLLIDRFTIPLMARKELLVTLVNQNPGLVQQKLSRIKSELGNDNVSQKQITNRAEFHKLLNDVDADKVNKLFEEISGFNIEETWKEQKEFVLLQEIYEAATTYISRNTGENINACIQGTWSHIINSVSQIDLNLREQCDQYLEKERKLEKQQNSITEENITPFVENLAGKLIQYAKDNPEFGENLVDDFMMSGVHYEEPKKISLGQQKVLAKINQEFTASIQEFLPNYDRSIPKVDEYVIIINELCKVKAMQDFVQGKSVDNDQVTEQSNKTTSIQIEEESNDRSQPLTQSSIASSDDIRNQIQEKNDEQRIGVQSVCNGLSGSTQTKFKSTSSKAYAIEIGCGMIIGVAIAYLAGAAALTSVATVIAVLLVAAVIGALVGYGISKFCEKVSEEKRENSDISTCAAVKSVLFGAFATGYSKTLQF